MSTAIELNGVEKRFGKTEIIRGVRPRREVRANGTPLIGPNGAGKSTLFNLICGRFMPTRGHDSTARREITGLPAVRDQPPRPVALLPGHQHLPSLTVWENVRCAVLWSTG